MECEPWTPMCFETIAKGTKGNCCDEILFSTKLDRRSVELILKFIQKKFIVECTRQSVYVYRYAVSSRVYKFSITLCAENFYIKTFSFHKYEQKKIEITSLGSLKIICLYDS